MPSKLSKLPWYWHRLWAMSPREILLRLQKKSHQSRDRRYAPPANFLLATTSPFPKLPDKSAAPSELLASLASNVDDILVGRWKAFGHLPLAMGTLPLWHADNLSGNDLKSDTYAFKLDHRAQPGGADIKVIWEPNRWYQLVRLAMAAWLLDHAKAQEKCLEWLHDWASQNPPFTGLNWTSGLETGIRLIQFTWIDAFLNGAGVPNKTLQELRGRILHPHVWYTWRYKSFGSSANNHLIGELAGLVIALARWPDLADLSAPIGTVGALLEREILAQFAEDGGNQEQALGYHLFSWEFCFQAGRALEAAAHPLSSAARERITKAGQFYCAAKPEGDLWDFGDSDNAWVTPLFADETKSAVEWWRWFSSSSTSPVLRYWWGDFDLPVNADSPPRMKASAGVPLSPRRGEGQGEGSLVPSRKSISTVEGGNPNQGWNLFPTSGYAVFRTNDWFLRLDISPLGYLSMAPHGHLDALHLSAYYRDVPVIIDPGTGAYYADKSIRTYLAGWAAHNSPHLKNPPADFPKRFGTFLWAAHHTPPRIKKESSLAVSAEFDLPYGRVLRSVIFLPGRNAFTVRDQLFHPGGPLPVVTRWKFAPEFRIERAPANEFRLVAGSSAFRLSSSWQMARTYNPPDELRGQLRTSSTAFRNVPLESLVSPAFRAITPASYLALESSEAGPFELTIAPE